jgi:general secretion pathway protein M
MRRDFSDELATAREQHARFTTAIADATAAAAELETRAESVDLSAFFTADTNVLAAADLQNQLRTLIGARRGTVASMNVVPTTEEGIFPPIGVTAILQCSIDCLMEILYAVETQSPALFVDELSVQSLHQPGRVLPTRDVELEIRLTVTGYRYVAAGGPEQRS